MDRILHGQDILWIGHFKDRTFHGQDISWIGYFMDRTFHVLDISWIGHFMDRTFQSFSSLDFCTTWTRWTRVNLNSNRTDPCAGLCDVRQVPARPNPILLGFNFDGAARLFTVPGLSQAYFTYPTSFVQCEQSSNWAISADNFPKKHWIETKVVTNNF